MSQSRMSGSLGNSGQHDDDDDEGDDDDDDHNGYDYYDNDDQITGMQRSLWLPCHPFLAARWRDCHFLSGCFSSHFLT